MPALAIGEREVGSGRPCFVIAEIGHNHQGDLSLAKHMIKAAKESGADAAKLQKRHLPTLFTERFGSERYASPHAFGSTYLEHRNALEFDAQQWAELADYAASIDLMFFGTAFDVPSADMLAELHVPVIKIASADAMNWPLLDHVASLGVPMIVSTGGLDWTLLDATVERLHASGAGFALLHCTSAYPCPPEELQLRAIPAMRERYPDVVIGYSGHEEGFLPTIGAVALGASIVERHFTTDQEMKGSDQRYSLNPDEMSEAVHATRLVSRSLGAGEKRRYASEASALHKLGKKLVLARPVPAGTPLTDPDVEVRSPADGLSPHTIGSLIGRVTLRDLQPGEDLRTADLR